MGVPSIPWLLSSLLFFFIAAVIAPLFWHQLSLAKPGTSSLPVNKVFGYAGLLIYFLEPVTWHYYAFVRSKEDVDIAAWKQRDRSKFSIILELVFDLMAGILITIPYIFLMIFKPVLRALILYVSLLYLGDMNEHSPLYTFFAIVVCADILLYYLGLMAPEWKYNPVHALLRRLRLDKQKAAATIAGWLLVIHTALISTLLLAVVYYDAKAHNGKPPMENLFFWWAVLTIYTRASYTNPDNGYTLSFVFQNRNQLFLHMLGLAVSFLAFIWPFYFA